MKKLISWCENNLLRILVVILLFGIPLYPKLPLLDIMQTWVYIRLEDFFVAFTTFILLLLLWRKKASFKSPLTKPILFYWLIGALSVIWAILFLSHKIPHFFPHLAFLHYLRRLEYMLVFFFVYISIRTLKDVYLYLTTFLVTLAAVIFYGFGQRFLGFPAFLTMNEEFSKGTPLYLPPTARITSTFGGHYDLAIYLVLLIALAFSLIFTLKKWWLKILCFLLACTSYVLLLLTASRVSFIAYLFAVSTVLFFHKKKLLIIPVIFLSFLVMKNLTGGASVRFGKTFRVEQVVFDTKTGKPITTLKQFTAKPTITPTPAPPVKGPTPTPTFAAPSTGGEDLPVGSGYLALPVITTPKEIIGKEAATPEMIRKVRQKPIFLESLEMATVSSKIATTSGEFLLTTGNYFVKRAVVYDISFTTRFQGEWPRAQEALKRNYLLGSGYSSISLATDNDYLRSLGETGILGFLTFYGIFCVLILVIRQILRSSQHYLLKGLAIGLLGGLVGLLFNALLIDVFEASKVAFVFWMFVGLVLGLSKIIPYRSRSLWQEAWDILSSPVSIFLFLGSLIFAFFYPFLENYFVADDFIWLKWAVRFSLLDVEKFFLSSDGFFYRPLAKTLFFFVQPIFSLEPEGYHLLNLLFHFAGTFFVYLLTLRLTKKKLPALLTSLFFLFLPIHEESLLWISGLSGLMAAVFYLGSCLFYFYWRGDLGLKRYQFWLISLFLFILSLCSHELAVTLPLMLIFYDLLYRKHQNKFWQESLCFLPYLIVLIGYLAIRSASGAHALSGDYNYRPSNLPFNFLGNFFGYLGEMLFSFRFVPLYQGLRLFLKTRKLLAIVVTGLLVLLLVIGIIKKKQRVLSSRTVIFSLGWLFITLLPFLGLGNIAERYAYLTSFGFVILLSSFLIFVKEKIQKKIGPKIALILLLLFAFLINFYYYSEMMRANRDWQEAGQITKATLLALSSNFKEFPPETKLVFANLPVKKGLAWVFPVGLDEGIWFIYRDESIQTYRAATVEEAFLLKQDFSGPNWVLVFEKGELKKAVR